MKSKQNPFRVRPIRKSWHEKFWKKGTWRTHHTALFAMMLVLGVAFGFDAAFGANVSAPVNNEGAISISPAPSRITPPAAIDAAAPNTPSGAPTGASTVTPKFSGANIQGYVFNQVGAESAETNPVQLYDAVNVWGGLNVAGPIINTGENPPPGVVGPGCNGYIICDPEYSAYKPGVRIDDVLDVDHGILNTSTSHGGYLNLLDAVEISLLNNTNVSADGTDKMLVLNNNFDEADIEFQSVNDAGVTWEIGSGRAEVVPPSSLYIANNVGTRLTMDEFNSTTSLFQSLSVVGGITGTSIGRFYMATNGTDSTAAASPALGYTPSYPPLIPGSYKEVIGGTAGAGGAGTACSAGDIVISCSAAQLNGNGGVQYSVLGAYPISSTACRAISKSAGSDSGAGTALTLYTLCFSPNG